LLIGCPSVTSVAPYDSVARLDPLSAGLEDLRGLQGLWHAIHAHIYNLVFLPESGSRSPRTPRTYLVSGCPIVRFGYMNDPPKGDLTPVRTGSLQPPETILGAPLPHECQAELLPELPGISMKTVGEPVRNCIPEAEIGCQLSDYIRDSNLAVIEYGIPGFKKASH